MLDLIKLIGLLGRDRLDPLEVFERVKAVVESMGCRAYIIGSRAEGREVPASDIDILVVCRNLPASMLERGKMKAEILEKAGVEDYEDVHIELITEDLAWFYRK
ncbi:MAG: nucleotidyltransferase domain-containing protein [Sulfolobales archaeon]